MSNYKINFTLQSTMPHIILKFSKSRLSILEETKKNKRFKNSANFLFTILYIMMN
jgi:hypothetical protein